MAYIRIKRAKRKKGNVCDYLYIVETRRYRKKRVKQKTKKYLGRVHNFDKLKEVDFYQFLNITDPKEYFDKAKIDEMIIDIVKTELVKHGFELLKNRWVKDGCFVNLDKRKVVNEKGNNIALGFNEGFLTGYALKEIINFKAYGPEYGYDFAKMFVEAGIDAPKDVFVEVFRKKMERGY